MILHTIVVRDSGVVVVVGVFVPLGHVLLMKLCCLLITLVYFCATNTWLSIKFERNQVLHIPQFVFFGPVSPKMATLASYLLTHFDFSSCIFGTYVSTKTATMACHLLTHLWFSICNYYTYFLQICKCHSHSRQLFFLDHWCIHIFSVKLFLWQCVLLLHYCFTLKLFIYIFQVTLMELEGYLKITYQGIPA